MCAVKDIAYPPPQSPLPPALLLLYLRGAFKSCPCALALRVARSTRLRTLQTSLQVSGKQDTVNLARARGGVDENDRVLS